MNSEYEKLPNYIKPYVNEIEFGTGGNKMTEQQKIYSIGHFKFIKGNDLSIQELEAEISYNEKLISILNKQIDLDKERIKNTQDYSIQAINYFSLWYKENDITTDEINSLNY